MRWTQKVLKNDWLESKKFSRKFYAESTRRLGKSSWLLILMIEECMKKPGVKCAFFAPVKDGLLDYIEPIINKTSSLAPEGYPLDFDRSRFMVNFENKSSIIFRGSNNQQHRIRRGQEFHLAAIDEARDVSDLDSLIDSVVFPALFDSDGYLIISSTPADTRSHPLYAIRQRAEFEGWLSRIPMSLANKIEPEIYSTERIAEWKSETLRGVDGEDVWKREYECEWVINKSRAAVAEWKPEYIRYDTPDPCKQFYRHYVGLDWGYKDYTALVLGTWNYRHALLEVQSELTFLGQDVRCDKIADALRSQARKTWGLDVDFREMTMASDSADPILINELNRQPDMNFSPVHKLNSLEAMLAEFRLLVSQGKILINPNCALTIHCVANGIWDEKRQKLDQDVLAHHFDHLMALVYLTRMLDRVSNPIPADFAFDGTRMIDIDFDRQKGLSDDAKALSEAFGGGKRRVA
jgi:hypothetical protein